jgi:hypothetical protein
MLAYMLLFLFSHVFDDLQKASIKSVAGAPFGVSETSEAKVTGLRILAGTSVSEVSDHVHACMLDVYIIVGLNMFKGQPKHT